MGAHASCERADHRLCGFGGCVVRAPEVSRGSSSIGPKSLASSPVRFAERAADWDPVVEGIDTATERRLESVEVVAATRWDAELERENRPRRGPLSDFE